MCEINHSILCRVLFTISHFYSVIFLGIKHVAGQWVTAHDNATLTYTYWDTDEPSLANGDCVAMRNERMAVVSCDENLRIACSVDAYGTW